MQGERLKEYLLQIAGQINEKTELEDIHQQLALLDDIDRAEVEEKEGEVIAHQDVVQQSKEWLK
jgi:hypothetical protein